VRLCAFERFIGNMISGFAAVDIPCLFEKDFNRRVAEHAQRSQSGENRVRWAVKAGDRGMT
jgi:hypothetical protein